MHGCSEESNRPLPVNVAPVCRMMDHRGMLDDLAALLRVLPPSRAARQETRRMEQQAGLGGAALVRMNATTTRPPNRYPSMLSQATYCVRMFVAGSERSVGWSRWLRSAGPNVGCADSGSATAGTHSTILVCRESFHLDWLCVCH